jgi:2,4-dienoyl-CoA reductase-like NADH-dependent reductase (Old Yellow Enzyme family)/NADPH-dependent 2,4-dienoyl-CoA reductase/sulfur reductase-like enzyme
MKFESTFEPINIGGVTVRNRLAVPAMDSHMAEPDGSIGEYAVDYYAARARGGFGLIIVEIAAVQKCGIGMPHEINVYEDSAIPGLTKLADGMQQYGARAFLQLHHAGRETVAAMAGRQPVSPSSVPCPVNMETPHEMTTEEVYELIQDYIDASVRSYKAGFDGVEIHAAHGYMGGQFLSPRSNKRIDEFGGGLEGRAYILKLIVEGIKKECGEDYPVIIRISSEEARIGGIEINESIVMAQLLESYGYDAINVSAGSYGSWDTIVPPPDFQPAWNLSSTKLIKSSVKIPVISVGRYNDPYIIDMAISRGDVDLICLGRQSIADPDFPNKMFSEKLLEIVPCIGCTQRCMSFNDPTTLQEGDYGVSCILNPMSNDRKDVRLSSAIECKKVMIAGAGPAGLEAAWVAAKRGHDVTLYEKNTRSKSGGQYLIAAYPPFKQELTKPIRHYLHMCEKYGVKLVFETEVTKELILKEKPDVLIIATGATPLVPKIKGIDGENIKLANDVLLGETVSGNVLVVGAGLVGVETAEYCTDYCESITIVDQLPMIAPEMYLTVRDSLIKRFEEEEIQIYTNTTVHEFTDDGIICETDGEQMTLSGFDTIILAIGSKAYNPFAEAEKLTDEVYTIGDAKEARSALEAIYEGFRIAQKI